MLHRKMLVPALAVGALALLAACADSPTAPAAATEVELYADQMSLVAVPDLSDFRNISGELWVCATGNGPGNDFHYAFWVRDQSTGTVVASGIVHNVSIGQCVLLATVPTNVRGHYTAKVKQDAPTTFYLAHGFFDFGAGYPTTPPPSAVDLTGRFMTSGLSNDGGVVMSFYNLHNLPPT